MDRSVDNGGPVERRIIDHAVRGRDKLIQAYHGTLEKWARKKLLSPDQQCPSKSICAYSKLLASQSYFSTEDGELCRLGPGEYDTSESQLCKPCHDSLVVAYDKAREKLWNFLPSFFGLSPWEELKDFDAAYNSSDTWFPSFSHIIR